MEGTALTVAQLLGSNGYVTVERKRKKK
jgi:hypothetical protein